MKGILVLGQVQSLVATAAYAGDDVIFDVKTGGGYYSTDSAAKQSTGGMIDVSGVLVIGNAKRSNMTAEIGLVSAVRDGGTELTEADVTFRGRYLEDGKFGFEVSALPFKYRKDDRYYEFSGIEVSALMKVAEGGGHQLVAKAGINPFVHRGYGNDFGSYNTNYAPEAVGSGSFNIPDSAHVFGAPFYQHDPDVDYNYFHDNRDVYFGGGTRTTSVNTSFDTGENSIRFPIALEYKYDNGQKLTINATAYYTLRVGRDSLAQVDKWRDQYDGYVSYSNVHWDICYDTDEDGDEYSYYCNPQNTQYAGEGRIIDGYWNETELAAKTFVGHTVGGKGEVNYEVFKNNTVKVLLNGTVRAELDSHVMVDGDVGTARTSKRFGALAGAIVRF